MADEPSYIDVKVKMPEETVRLVSKLPQKTQIELNTVLEDDVRIIIGKYLQKSRHGKEDE